LKLAKAPEGYSASDQAQLRGQIEREDAQNIKKNTAVPHLLITKPDGTVGRLTIDSTGNPKWAAL
jgi:hypothetical protein